MSEAEATIEGVGDDAPAAAAPPAADTEAASERTTPNQRWLLQAAAALVVLLSLFGPISASGIWDPHELRVADLARRIALTLLGGGAGLALEDGINTVPTLGELARGQLPFTSVALGFRLFGLHEWAGRLPLALWGLLGVLATYALTAKLADRAAAAFSALCLATLPMYFLHSRTILGDVVTMASLAIAVAGLGIAVFDDQTRGARRVLWALLGAVGVAAGFAARGALLGVAVPTLAVAASWLLVRSGRKDRLADAVGVLALSCGLVALALGGRALAVATDNPDRFSMVLGAAVAVPRQLPTYDAVIHALGHGLFPWSAVIPFAIGRAFRLPQGAPAAARRQTALRVLALLSATFAFGVLGVMAPVTGMLPFPALCAFAILVGVALRDFELGAPGSRAMAMGVAAFAILFYTDFKNFPEKGLSAFVVEGARFPASFKDFGTRVIKYGTLAMIAVFFAVFFEQNDDGRRRFDRSEYVGLFKTLRSTWNGNLWFSFLVAQAALCGYAVLTLASERYLHLRQIESMSPAARQLAKVGWLVLPVAVLVLPPLVVLARDVSRLFFAKLPVSRAVVALAAVVGFGGVMSLSYYPALAAQISPKEVFDAYKRLAAPDERLAILGVGAGSASYYAGRDVPNFNNATSAFEWLMQADERRWLVTRSEDVPQLNSLYRSRAQPTANLPVLDARSSEILLVSNRLGQGEQNENPFADWISSQAPKPSRPVDANLGGQLDNLGWDVKTLEGDVVDAVVPGKPYLFVIHWKVVAPISGNWETFIHIDGFQRRYNGDHVTLEGKYPFHLWRVGDYVTDIHQFTLEPNFTPGEYQIFYGLFIGNRRLEVKRGAHHENRIEAGRLRVR